eukprot:TRINITY_DN603_c0_g7_i1.p1 TRINITY_DN603_c0_g7~~TRINITY_DN603_c0_g7_i1.p1  ORF type:complete len:277 (-),score=56.89 TRINITY_DN603_c0_g7_i1:264-1094(-)
MNSFVDTSIVATNVDITLLLHKHLFIKQFDHSLSDSENDSDSERNQLKGKDKRHKLVRHVGNATKNTEINFEYGISQELKKEPISSLPFQLQIRYTTLTGTKAIRTISKSVNVTHDQEEALKTAHIKTLCAASAQKSAIIAQKGGYGDARASNVATLDLLARVATQSEENRESVQKWVKTVGTLDTSLLTAQKQERELGLDLSCSEGEEDSDDSDDDGDQSRKIPESSLRTKDAVPDFKKKSKRKMETKNMMRSKSRNDSQSNTLFQTKLAHAGLF